MIFWVDALSYPPQNHLRLHSGDGTWDMLEVLTCCSSQSQLEVPVLVEETLSHCSVWVGFVQFCYAAVSKLMEVLPREKQNSLGNRV